MVLPSALCYGEFPSVRAKPLRHLCWVLDLLTPILIVTSWPKQGVSNRIIHLDQFKFMQVQGSLVLFCFLIARNSQWFFPLK